MGGQAQDSRLGLGRAEIVVQCDRLDPKMHTVYLKAGICRKFP